MSETVWTVFVCDKPDPPQPMKVGFVPGEYEGCQCGESLRSVEVVPKSELDRAVSALKRIRDHGETHGEPCWALHQGDCADQFQEIARATLDSLKASE